MITIDTWLNSCECTDIKPVILQLNKNVYNACFYTQNESDRIYVVCENNYPPQEWYRRHKVYVIDNHVYYLAGFYPGTMFIHNKWAEYWANITEQDKQHYHPFGANMILIKDDTHPLSKQDKWGVYHNNTVKGKIIE